MEPYTLNRDFSKQDVIDGFSSVIWTERYYGNSDVELMVPITADMMRKLPLGVFLSVDGSDEIMILETMNIKDGKLKYTGISLLQWLNNRFIRASNKHNERYWIIEGAPGFLLWLIVYSMCVEGSPFLDGTIDTGIDDPEHLAIPGLGLDDYDNAGESIKIGVPYGPVYDALRDLATTYEIGMQILLEPDQSLGFRSYRGLDRTSGQTENPPVRFSTQLDSLTDVEELQSIAPLKTQVYSFSSFSDPEVATTPPGESHLTGPEYTGFDLRALQLFVDDLTSDMMDGDPDNLEAVLDSRAYDALTTNRFMKTVDGEIVPLSQFKYGVHYNMGDLIETQGNTGVISISRVTEYIRSQDEAGYKEYPTVEMLS